MKKSASRASITLLLLAAYVLLSAQVISFATSANDLARHLRDGELILAGQTGVLHDNFYSYTHPDAEFLNHHWLAAVLFHLLYQAGGPVVLNIFYLCLGALGFLIYFLLAEKRAGLAPAACLAALLLPLMAARAGVRPEVFSVLFLAVFLYVLLESTRWLWTLPVLEVVWVNLHPGFILGPVLVGVFLCVQIAERRWNAARTTALLLLATLAAGLCNPNGVRGLLFPITVAANYAMPVGENRSVFFWQGLWQSNMVELTAAALLIGAVRAYRRRTKIEWPLLLFSAIAAVGALAFFRVYVFFGGVALVSLCAMLRGIRIGPPAVVLCVIVAALNSGSILSNRWNLVGLGLNPGEDALARFMTGNQIRGRVFNSYASGGYLIQFLRDMPVYVDSRPEAYPSAFIREDYLRPLSEEAAWRRVLEKYDFDIICFLRLDETDGQFVIRRIQDPEWALVSLGAQGNVLLRRKPQFTEVIRQHEVQFR